jgi:hypothetical protein
MITGKMVARSVFKDTEEFFLKESGFRINTEFNSPGLQHISIKGVGTKARIRLSSDFSGIEINSLDDLFYLAIMLCHEISHYLNKHNDHVDESEADIKALESWADLFGAKIFMSVITYGKNTHHLITSFGKIEQDVVLKSIGRSIGNIFSEVYMPNTDERYPHPTERVGLFHAGVVSFFYRLHGELKPRFILYVLHTLMKNSGMSNFFESHNTDWSEVNKIIERSTEIHVSLQKHEIAITVGLKPQYIPILVTNYRMHAEEINENKERLRKELKKIDFEMNDI